MPAKAVRRPSTIHNEPATSPVGNVKTPEQRAQDAAETKKLKAQLAALKIGSAPKAAAGPTLPITPSSFQAVAVPQAEPAAELKREDKQFPEGNLRFIDAQLYGLGIAHRLREELKGKQYARKPMAPADQLMRAEECCFAVRNEQDGLESDNFRSIPPIMALEAFLAAEYGKGSIKVGVDLPALIETASATIEQTNDRTGDDAFAKLRFAQLVAAVKSLQFAKAAQQFKISRGVNADVAKALAMLYSKELMGTSEVSRSLPPPGKQAGPQRLEDRFFGKLKELSVERGVTFTRLVNVYANAAGGSDRDDARNDVFDILIRQALQSALSADDFRSLEACIAPPSANNE